MSRRARIILIAVIALLVVPEVVLRVISPSRSSVEILNEGTTPVENLVVVFQESRVAVGSVPPGERKRVWLSGTRKGALSLEFTQSGNALSGFLLDDFDPRALARDGLKQVVAISPNQVMKYMDDEESATPMGRLMGRIGEWVSAELGGFR